MKFDLSLPEDKEKLLYIIKNNKEDVIDFKVPKKQRTLRQNSSLHLWFTLLTTKLNAAGIDIRMLIDESVSLPFTESFIKEYIWRPTQRTLINKESTSDLETHEINEIYEVVDQIISERTGIHQEFPNWDYMIKSKE